MSGPITPTASVKEITIASGQSLSDVVNLEGKVLVGISMPASWDAASLTLRAQTVSASGTVEQDLYDESGAEFTIAADADRMIYINPTAGFPLLSVRFRSGTASTPVTQSANRTLRLLLARHPNAS